MPEAAQLSPADWGQIGTALKFLWLAFACALLAGTTLVTAHAFIPSAVATNTIPAKYEKLRVPLYATGLLAVAGIVVALSLAAINADDIISKLHPRYWQ